MKTQTNLAQRAAAKALEKRRARVVEMRIRSATQRIVNGAGGPVTAVPVVKTLSPSSSLSRAVCVILVTARSFSN